MTLLILYVLIAIGMPNIFWVRRHAMRTSEQRGQSSGIIDGPNAMILYSVIYVYKSLA